MIENGRIPTQKEFKNENGLPSYNAAGRALEVSPAEYMKERFDEVMAEGQEEAGLGMSMQAVCSNKECTAFFYFKNRSDE